MLHSKRSCQQSIKFYWMREDICEGYIWRRVNFQNIQTSHRTPYKKRRYTDDQ